MVVEIDNFPPIREKLDAICILPCIRTFVIRQADDVRRQFTTSDKIRKVYLSMSECPSTKDKT